MIAQLLVTLIEAVRRSKEGDRIGYMDGHGNSQASATLPHRIEAGIINLHQRSGGGVLTQIKPKRLQNLEATCSISVSLNNSIGLQLRVIRPREEVIRGFGK